MNQFDEVNIDRLIRRNIDCRLYNIGRKGVVYLFARRQCCHVCRNEK